MKRIFSALLVLCVLFCCTSQMRVHASASVFEHSDSYRSSEYYDNLLSVSLTGDPGTDIAAVALSQVGYHEGKSAGDLSGSSSGKANYTEYGFNFGLAGDAWCSSFVWWCARQAGIGESIIHKTEWAKKSLQPFDCIPLSQCRNISVGDIAFVDMNNGDGIEDHMGIVVAVTDDDIVTVEGNTSNAVRTQTYSRSTGLRSDGTGVLLFIGTPHYNGSDTSFCEYNTVFASAPGADAYSAINGSKTGSLGNGKYMVLASDPTGSWLQIVASNGIDSLFISAADAILTSENLPPITGYDAWSTFDPSAYTPPSSEDINAPIQTDPSVTTTAPSGTSASATTTQTSTAPMDLPTESDNGYTSSFGSDWIHYAAYVLLGVLAVAFVVILASLMGRKD